MVIRTKRFVLNIIGLTTIIVAGYLCVILLNLNRIKDNPKLVLVLVLSPGPIFFLYFYYSFMFVLINKQFIRYNTIFKKHIIKKEEVEKLVILSYKDSNNIEQILVYKKKTENDILYIAVPKITITNKKYDLSKIFDAFKKYKYEYALEYL